VAHDWSELFITGESESLGDGGGPEQTERRRGFFSRLRENLTKTRQAFAGEIQATLFQNLDEHTWERLEEALIMADVGAATTAAVVGELELAGTPAFAVSLADTREDAPSFEALRTAIMNVAQKGSKLQRFKGLGEMNAEQLADTTMDPAARTLAQVTLEDAAAADRIFSMLMGDQVQPRRAFIEDNARAVVNLDV
jgi:DNA gyrase/topoisomerase IV subunit B